MNHLKAEKGIYLLYVFGFRDGSGISSYHGIVRYMMRMVGINNVNAMSKTLV